MLNPVQLFYIDRPEEPGFEAVSDVSSGFGKTAVEALEALGAAIETGPVKFDPNFLHLGVAHPTGPAAGGIDYDKLAEALVRAQAKAVDETAADASAAPTPAPAPVPVSPPPPAAAPVQPPVQVGPVDLTPQEAPAGDATVAAAPPATSGAQPGPVPGV